jgi:hypothetical protein
MGNSDHETRFCGSAVLTYLKKMWVLEIAGRDHERSRARTR